MAEARMYLALQADDSEKAKAEYAKVRDLRSERKALLQLRMGTRGGHQAAASAVKIGLNRPGLWPRRRTFCMNQKTG